MTIRISSFTLTWFSLLTLFLITSSCGKKDELREEEELAIITRARLLMNKGKVDEAIDIYNEYLEDHPQDHQIEFELSTAYASKAKIDVFGLFPILKLKLFQQPAAQWGKDNSRKNPFQAYINSGEIFPPQSQDPADPNSEKKDYSKAFIISLLNLSWQIYNIVPYFALTPTIVEDGKFYVDHAIKILRRLSREKKGDDKVHLYLGLLAAIQFINELKKLIPREKSQSATEILCSLKKGKIEEKVKSLIHYGEILLEAISNIKLENKNMTELSEQLKKLKEFMNEEKNHQKLDLYYQKMYNVICQS